MTNPRQPDRRLQALANQQAAAAASGETNRPADSTPVVAGSFASLPAVFGRYRVEKLLGRGAMGAVYLARDTHLDRAVALKIPKVAASGSNRLLMRLETEAKAAAKLDHPSLCKVFDAGAVDGQCFIAMQYIEGETLKSQLETSSKSVAEAVSLIVQLAEGLSEAHALGIIHRDLKPENIMINRRGTPVIMDFGLAKFSTLSGNAAATQAGTILGSPAYMSPEQASGNLKAIDQRSDIYALGVIFFELLTGQWPFTGAAMHILGQKSLLDPASPLTIRPELPPQLAAVCTRMIARSNADRYQTLGEVVADLKPGRWDDQAPVAVRDRPEASSPSSQSAVPDISIVIATADLHRKPAKANGGQNHRRRLLIGGALLGLLIVVAGVVINLQVKRGTLQVKVPKPDAKVKVDQAKGEIEIDHNDGSGPTTITEDPGGNGVAVTKNGVTVAGQDLQIKTGAEEPITAKLVPITEPPAAKIEPPVASVEQPVAVAKPVPSKAADAANRRAAEYWFNRVTTEAKRGHLAIDGTKVNALSDLPAGSFRITGWNVHHMTNRDFEFVAELTELVELIGVNAGVSAKSLEPLAKMNKLENINFTYASINDDCLGPLGKITSLKTLNLFGDPVTDNGIKQLAGLKNLTFLELTRSRVTEAGVAELKKDLPNCRIKLH